MSGRLSSKAFHPELAGLARWLPRSLVSERTLKLGRMGERLTNRLASKEVEVCPVGSVSVRLHRPASGTDVSPALLWMHGGGYVGGTAAQDDKLCRHYAETLGIVVAAVDYRIAPEHRFPTGLHDCHDALSWLAQQPYVDAARLAIGGASAGGGMAAALALLARQRAEVELRLQLLSYPMLDDRTATRTDIDETNVRAWNNKANRFGWQSYTGFAPGSSEVSELAAPARCDDLTGLPPAWIGVGTLDLFCQEDLAYASRLQQAGVACQLEVVEGAFHGFDLVRRKAQVSQAYRTSQVDALAAVLH